MIINTFYMIIKHIYMIINTFYIDNISCIFTT